ncbi:hypothetical protein KAX14_04210, partial [Candidatus Bipolaricaulota bacterium]|nr:hypothetical protein [Candidatus Bipolaricaulota bacterium]
GSGSFLLGAYQKLLHWHLEWYAKHDPEKHARGRNPKIFHGPGGAGNPTAARLFHQLPKLHLLVESALYFKPWLFQVAPQGVTTYRLVGYAPSS